MKNNKCINKYKKEKDIKIHLKLKLIQIKIYIIFYSCVARKQIISWHHFCTSPNRKKILDFLLPEVSFPVLSLCKFVFNSFMNGGKSGGLLPKS